MFNFQIPNPDVKIEDARLKRRHKFKILIFKLKTIFVFYFFTLLGLFFYSFTQVDLNLTLSKISLWFAIQDFFQHIGYFQRPFSTTIYLILIFLLFTNYYLLIWLVRKKRLSEKQLWFLILITAAILLFSYPAFSHDIFNYIFDARIFTKYRLNPYHFKPLDFPQDPWTRFMHWTHVTYSYGPAWLLISIPFSFLGMGKFLPTLFLFKLLSCFSYLGSVFLLGKILEKIDSPKKLLGIAFFAFNPLVIIEALVSAHHESVIIFFTFLFVYFLIENRKALSFPFFLLSAGIKYVTAPLFPLLILGFKKRLAMILMIASLVFVLIKKEIQPWYFLWVLPFIALNIKNWLMLASAFFSFGLLLRYAPFLYYGHWDPPVPTIKFWATIIPMVLFFLVWCFSTVLRRTVEKRV